MGSTLDYVEELRVVLLHLVKLRNAMRYEFDYKVNRVLASYNDIFERFCPFKDGDRIYLVKTPDIDEKSSWYTSRHFLTEGATGKVLSRDYYKNKFCFSVEFDNESWIDEAGNQHLVLEGKQAYTFNEDWLALYAAQ